MPDGLQFSAVGINKNIFYIKHDPINYINQVDVHKDNQLVLTYKDEVYKDEFSPSVSWKRTVGNTIYYYSDDCLLLRTENTNRKTTFMLNKKDISPLSSFATFDIETIATVQSGGDDCPGADVTDENLTPYLVSIYNGTVASSYFLSDYSDSKKMLSYIRIN